MKIGIDIDDTIAKSYEQISEFLKEKENYTINDDDIYYHDPVVKEYYSRRSDEFSAILDTKDDAVEIINKLKEDGYEIYFITSRGEKYYKDAYGVTYKWLVDKGFNFDKLYTECLTKDSICEELGINYFIDDSIKHINSVRNKNINTYLFTSYFNIRFDEKSRVNSWKEIYELLRK